MKVDQREGFLGFGFLQFHRGIEGGRGLGQGRIDGQTRRSGAGIFEDLAIEVQHRHGRWIQPGHPGRIDLAQLAGRNLFQQAGESAFAGDVKLPARAGPWPAAQPASLARVETVGKLRDGVRSLIPRGDGQSGQANQTGDAMTDAARVARVLQPLVDVLPQRVHPGGLDRRQRRQGAAGIDEFRGQWLGAQPCQGVSSQRTDPQLFGVLEVQLVVLPTALKTFGLAQSQPASGFVAGPPKTLRIDKRLGQEHRMAEVASPILGQAITHQLEDPRGQVGPAPRRRQDEKAAVLRHQMTPLGNLPRRPMQVTIARLEMQRSRSERQHRDPCSPILRDIAQHPANGVGVAQVVFLIEQLIMPTAFLVGLNQPHGDVSQEPAFGGQPFQNLIRLCN